MNRIVTDILTRKCKMPAQSKLTTFFSTNVKNKSNLRNSKDDAEEMSTRKKQKLSRNDEPVNEPNVTNAKVENNKLAAETKLQSKKTPVLSANIGTSWFKALKPEFSKEYFVKLSKFIESERKSKTVFPPDEDVWSWTQNCNINQIKVVILGQDPYHGPQQAHGLSFSVKKDIAVPPSLRNMFKELENDVDGFKIPSHGNLLGWATQGVLMLNAVLTVRSGEPNSHKDRGWEKITDATIKYINEHNNQVVFLLWGKDAQKKGSFINKKKHCVLTSVHPSPLSASRGFFGCKHFSKANEYLSKNCLEPIDWTNLPAPQ